MSRKSKKNRSHRYRAANAVFVLPNLLTTANLFFGFFSIILSINGRFTTAAMVILIAVVFDVLDGRVARLANATSHFGKEYDSLVDLVSFGIAPALLSYLWAMTSIDRFGWLTAFLFVACGALRLARFNTLPSTGHYFLGLPIPAAAGVVVTTVLFCNEINYMPSSYMVLVGIFLLSFLMVSNVHYPSMKKSFDRKRINFQLLVAAVLVVIFIAAKPQIGLFTVMMLYLISGPIWYGRYLLSRKKSVSEEASSTNEEL